MTEERTSTIFDPKLFKGIVLFSHASGKSMLGVARSLLRIAKEHEEDRYWVTEGERRLATWDDSKALTHEEVWGRDTESGRGSLLRRSADFAIVAHGYDG